MTKPDVQPVANVGLPVSHVGLHSKKGSRTIGIVGPYPPYRGGIAHFTEQFHVHLAGFVGQVSDAGQGITCVGVSFCRQYPSFLFPGKSQFAEKGDSVVESKQILDSINPLSWARTAQYLIDSGVDEVVFMYWMPFFAPAYLRIGRLLGRAGIGVTAMVHNASPHEKQPFGDRLTRAFLSRCDRIIALSGTVKRDIVSIGVDRDILVAMHPVYSQFGDAIDPKKARKKLGVEEIGPVILFFGLVRRYKGLDILLKALPKTTSNAILIVAGEWYEGKAELHSLIKEGNLADRVLCRDEYIPDSEVRTYFSAADVLVQPYRNATQSGVVQTAFHFGLPSIVSGVGGLPEMVEHEVNGLVVAPEDPEALARAIDDFYEGTRKERLTEGAKQIREGFSWESFVTRFLN